MPQPRKLSFKQERDAFAEFVAANGKRGTIAALASKYGLSWPGMKVVLARVERETNSNVPRGTFESDGAEA